MLAFEPGAVFAERFEILKSLGAGGMGAVYLGCDLKHRDFLVALKVIYPGIIRTQAARERFRNEIVASYRLNHKNIVRAYEFFDGDEYQAYAMEYVDGGDLAALMKKGAVPALQAIDIVKQIAAGLEIIHQNGIVHRDLKPENLLLTKKGVVKISDFGVARLRGSNTLTQAGAIVGTPKYVSPEYIEMGECDHRGDIYAVGVMAYELLAGISPFKSTTKTSMMLERFSFRPEEMNAAVPNCPPILVSVVQKAIAVSLTARYQTAKELREDLERVEQQLLSTGTSSDLKSRSPSSDWSGGGKPSGAVSGNATRLDTARPKVSGAVKGAPAKRKRRRLKLKLIALLLALLLAAGGITLLRGGEPVLAAVAPGMYSGNAEGVLGANDQSPFVLWSTPAGVFALLGKEGCAVARVAPDGRFSCGDLRFRLMIAKNDDTGAEGTIEEEGWGTRGMWRGKKKGGQP